MDEWYIKNPAGDVFGPATLHALRQWATEGRITPEDFCSVDTVVWQPAYEVPELELDCEILMEDGQTYGPIHALALNDLLADGSIAWDTPVTHTAQGEAQPAAMRLCRALTDEHARALNRIEDLKSELAKWKSRPPVERIRPVAPDIASPAAEPEKPEYTADATRLGDGTSEREAGKWKQLFETETAERLASEQALKETNRDLREQLHEVQAVKNRLAFKVNQMERQLDGSEPSDSANPPPAGAVHDVALQEAYQQLSDNYDRLLIQLREKGEEAAALRQHGSSDRQQVNEQLRKTEDLLHAEQEEAEKTRRQLTELESSHRDLIRSYREMNDKYIRLRQQLQPTPET